MAIITLNRGIIRPKYMAGGGGSLVNGGGFVLTGSGWGADQATARHYLKDSLEAASVGTNLYDIPALSAAGWANSDGVESNNNGGHRTKVAANSPAYGAHCFDSANPGNGFGTFGCALNVGAAYQSIFMRDYVRIAGPASTGQWKMFRCTYGECNTDDARSNAYWSNTWGFAFDALQVNEGAGCGAGMAGGIYTSSGIDYNTAFGVMYERQMRMVFGSQGVANGVGAITFRRLDTWAETSTYSFTNVLNFSSGNSLYRPDHFILQNYQGNAEFDTMQSTVSMDATAITINSQQRVYFSPQSTWTAVKSTGARELQKIITWADGVITGECVQGILSSMAGLYAYVVDNSGTVNENGYTPVAT